MSSLLRLACFILSSVSAGRQL